MFYCIEKRDASRITLSFVMVAMHVLLVAAMIAKSSLSVASDDPPSSNDVGNTTDVQLNSIALGLGGIWKVGYPTPLNFSAVCDRSIADKLSICIQTVDGDGVEVVSRFALRPTDATESKPDIDWFYCATEVVASNPSVARYQCQAIIESGRANRLIRIYIENDQRRTLVSHTLSDHERGSPIPASQPWVAGLGELLYLDQVSQQSAQGRLASYTSCELKDAMQLPHHAAAYRGVNLLVIPTSSIDYLQGLSVTQTSALTGSVIQGLRCQIWIGSNADAVNDIQWLKSILPVQIQGVAPNSESATLESFLSSQKRLGKLTLGRLSTRDGIVDLTDRSKLPLIVRGAVGLGIVQVVAADLNLPPISEWTDRKLLLEKLLTDSIEAPRELKSGSASQVALLGYDDMAGQLRSSLDVFASVATGNLMSMAMVLIVIIGLIGPFDYFVIQRWLHRSIWTWYSLVLWTLLSIVGIAWWTKATKPAQNLINSLELIDVDYTTKSIRGNSFFCQYSGIAGKYRLAANSRDPLTESRTTGNERRNSPIHLSWNGQPGAGLGGFDSTVRTDFGYLSYELSHGQINDLGIAAAATKSLRGEWQSEVVTDIPAVTLKVTSGSDFLEGSWTNPMQEDLLNGMLIYRGFMYRLPSRIRAGGSIRLTTSDIPKDLSRYLQQRQTLKESEFGIPWNPGPGVEMDRLVNLLTMFQSSGGISYTGLAHRYWNRLDLTPLAKLNRAIVFGKLSQPVVEWVASKNGEQQIVRDMNRSSYIRFVVPIGN